MKRIIGITAILLPLLSFGQGTVKPLNIGDTLPDITLTNLINYKAPAAKLSEFKTDLVLLDFWSTWCGACIKSFPEMDSLSNHFKKQMQVVLVNTRSKFTKDTREKIMNTFTRLNKRTGSNIQLPITYNDDYLDALFPLTYVPQIVWISHKKVIAITGPAEVTEANISAVLAGNNTPDVHMKQDLAGYDTNLPLFVNNNGGSGEQMLYRSMLTDYIEGVGGSNGFRLRDNKITGSYALNVTLLALIKDAYNDVVIYSDNRIIIESTDKYLHLPAGTPRFKSSFCYELVIPPSEEKQVRQYMRDDLKRYFSLTASRQTRSMKCLVLSRIPGFKNYFDKSSKRSLDLESDTKYKYIHNCTPAFTVHCLNEYSPLPIVDETGSGPNISLDLPFDLTDTAALKKVFQKAGFTLNEAQRELEVAVISDL